MAKSVKRQETDLYQPIKDLLLASGYEVKGEVGALDVLGVNQEGEMVAVECKVRLNLTLMLQGVDRMDRVDKVYLATFASDPTWRKNRARVRKLVRLLGLGLLLVDTTLGRAVEEVPWGPYTPRKNKRHRARLLKEFTERMGDPTQGGSAKRGKRLTAYRQKAVIIAQHLAHTGPSRANDVKTALNIPNARQIMYQNHYGWFDRPEKGIYQLSDKGQAELPHWSDLLNQL